MAYLILILALKSFHGGESKSQFSLSISGDNSCHREMDNVVSQTVTNNFSFCDEDILDISF